MVRVPCMVRVPPTGSEESGSPSDCVPMVSTGRAREFDSDGDLVAYVRCAGILAKVNAGDTMHFDTKYRIRSGLATSGKAGVLQSNLDDMRGVTDAETSMQVTITFDGTGQQITINQVKPSQKPTGLWRGHIVVMVGSIVSACVIMLGVGACGYIHMHAKQQARLCTKSPDDGFLAVSPIHKQPLRKTVSGLHPAAGPVVPKAQWSELEDV